MIVPVIVAFTAALAAMPPPQTARDVAGLWRTETDGGVVRLSACGASLCAEIVDSARLRANPNQQDVRNADASKRSRPLKGLRILQASPEGPGRWADGWVYNPEDGRTYRGSMRLLEDGRMRLTGCVVRPLCRNQTWRRID